MKLRFQKTLMGLAAVAAAVTLAGCGQGASSTMSSSSSAPASAKTSKTTTSKADALIQKGDYQGALDTVKKDQSNSDNQALASDLQNYLTAKKDYQNKNYDQALTSLNTASSSSAPMKQAYTDLRTKINTARQQASQSNSSQSSSSSQATSSSKVAINANVTQNTSESVINAFASKEGFNQSGYGISPVAKNGNVYRFEVRKNNADNTVANLVGIYEYNASTGAVTKIA